MVVSISCSASCSVSAVVLVSLSSSVVMRLRRVVIEVMSSLRRLRVSAVVMAGSQVEDGGVFDSSCHGCVPSGVGVWGS
jgi:hypothetical protein